jgi:DNA-binding transcriptional LysR family regulator
MMELQDLRIVLALARHGSATAAGRKLKMSHTTVLRAVAEIEARLGYAIFVRTPDGAVATAEGEELLEAARAVEQAMDAANRRFGALDDTVEGTVRLATNLPLAELLLPRLGQLRDTAPMLTLELLINQRSVDLARDADVAVRHLRPDADRDHPLIVVRTAASAELAWFASDDYVRRRGAAGPDLAGHDVIDYTGHEWSSRAARSAAADPRASRIITTDSTHVALAAVAAGLGVCALPCYLARPRRLVQLGAAVDRSDIAVLFAGDMGHVPRIRALIDAVTAALTDCEALAAGGGGAP